MKYLSTAHTKSSEVKWPSGSRSIHKAAKVNNDSSNIIKSSSIGNHNQNHRVIIERQRLFLYCWQPVEVYSWCDLKYSRWHKYETFLILLLYGIARLSFTLYSRKYTDATFSLDINWCFYEIVMAAAIDATLSSIYIGGRSCRYSSTRVRQQRQMKRAKWRGNWPAR